MGNQFVNAQGKPVQLRGVNLSGMEFVAVQGWDPSDPTGGGFGQPNNPEWAAISSWKANAVRIPLNEDSWLALTCTDIDGNTKNADPGANYKSALANLVQGANAAGLYVILDLHWAAPGTLCPEDQGEMADADHSLAFWTSIANTYKNNPAVIFELFNEPFFGTSDFTGNAWSYMMSGTGGSFTGIPEAGPGTGPNSAQLANPYYEDVQVNWNIASYQAMLNAVRATGATNVVLVGTMQYSQDLSQWLAYKPTDPLNQMAAAWHPYPTFGQTWENPCTGSDDYCVPNFAPAIFTEVQGILAAGIPVIATETGDQDTSGTVGAPLVATVTAFADAPGSASTSSEPEATWPAVSGLPPVSVLGWTWDVWSDSNNVLIQNVGGTPTPGYGQFYQNWLVKHL